MSGLMRRFSRGRAATDDEATPPATGTSEAAGDAASETRPAGGEPLPSNGAVDPATEVTAPGTAASEPATVAEPATTLQPATGGAGVAESEVPGRDLPAGVDLDGAFCAPWDPVRWREALRGPLSQADPRVDGHDRAQLFSADRMAARVVAAWRDVVEERTVRGSDPL